MKALCLLSFSGEKYGMPSNTENKSQHGGDKELKCFFYSLDALLVFVFINIKNVAFLKFSA